MNEPAPVMPPEARSRQGGAATSRRSLLLSLAGGLAGIGSRWSTFGFGVSAFGWPRGAHAQPGSYPQRPLRLVLGFPPGGTTDHSARLVALKMAELLALAVSGLDRSPALPQLPTMAAPGVKDYAVSAWGGLLAPTGTPAAVVHVLNTAGNAALRTPELVARAAESGSELQGGTPERFGAWIAQELARWKLAVAAAGDIGQ
ncbi:tripartite tricarboxylate transporter substrate-binding protein [Verminephrobacter eiseniae]|uniref:tripartite tricarboxylate transporter substrate-binding protein n=1 Tax=Verminephrobacter eiseniae TaxID=364317 RepID=UPI002238B44D|nr:tripartite tricarboxylate transporter substrate-binding protein [Verminephrobacter eiseniae]MCW5232954.1 hypothetical protein [Verminephrobacter eiseniae]MCW5295490.1 hypothetical protein [Verminephrobacter eiseniae]MCW8185893.1 hypothetical protein [Verminephrobacter eiseniae]MCW8223739.1 hypothetical protein [Verminephrobacter eiseniae]MCW8232915.1 hypothetical protein [Verminephrobacter eiseniae]